MSPTPYDHMINYENVLQTIFYQTHQLSWSIILWNQPSNQAVRRLGLTGWGSKGDELTNVKRKQKKKDRMSKIAKKEPGAFISFIYQTYVFEWKHEVLYIISVLKFNFEYFQFPILFRPFENSRSTTLFISYF